MSEDNWYFGGDELLLITDEEDVLGYDSLNLSEYRSDIDDDE